MRTRLKWFVAAIVATTSAAASAQAPAEDECRARHFSDRPATGGEPTPVSVSMYIIDISEIDDRHQTFDAEFYFAARWSDPRLAREAASGNVCTFALVDIWNPKLRLLNQRDVAKRFEDVVKIDSAGNVSYEQRFAGVFISAGDVSDFPFDKRILAISMVASGFTEDDIALAFDERLSGRRDTYSLANWTLSAVETDVSNIHVLGDISYTRARIAVQASRMARYYIWNALVPLMMIVFMSWGVFWIGPRNLGPQVGLAATSMLTLIAYRFTLANVLPPVTYLTRMDTLLIALSGLVLLAFFEAIIVGAIAERGSNRASRTDPGGGEDHVSRSARSFPARVLRLLIPAALLRSRRSGDSAAICFIVPNASTSARRS